MLPTLSDNCPGAGRHPLPNASAPKQEERTTEPAALIGHVECAIFARLMPKGRCRLNKNSSGIPGNTEHQVNSHLVSAIRQDQGKRLMFEPPSGLDVTRNWALALSPGIVIVATTWWL